MVPDGHSTRSVRRTLGILGSFLLLTWMVVQSASAQNASPLDPKINRERGLDILSEVKETLVEHYYDPTLHGTNIEERYKQAKERIKGLQTNGEIFRVIAQFLLDLNDSHTFFIPPSHFFRTEYGFSMQMFGTDCRIINVKRASDAQRQGLHNGDRLLQIGNIPVTRATLWKLKYLLYRLEPESVLSLTVEATDGQNRKVSVRSRSLSPEEAQQEGKHREQLEKRLPELKLTPFKCHEFNSDLIACKLYSFMVEHGVIDRMMREVSGHKKLILDLRGNPGGRLDAETQLTSYFFDHDIKIGTRIRKNKRKDQFVKSRGDKAFSGELLVMVDSDSASAAEIFARTIQIQGRGKVIGDVTAGAVMEAMFFPLASIRGIGAYSFYGVSITMADFEMSDGQRLEAAGVIPDVPARPIAQALAENADPVLAYVVSSAGTRITAQDAGKLYFIRRVPEPGEEAATETPGPDDED